MKEYNIEDYLNPELSKEIIEELVKENIRLELKENAELKETIDRLLKIQYGISANATKLEETLNAIKEIAENAPAIDTELSQRILEVIKESEVGE